MPNALQATAGGSTLTATGKASVPGAPATAGGAAIVPSSPRVELSTADIGKLVCPAYPSDFGVSEPLTDEFLASITIPVPAGTVGEKSRTSHQRRPRVDDVDTLLQSLRRAAEEVTLLFHAAKAIAKRGPFGLTKVQLAKSVCSDMVSRERTYVKQLGQLLTVR